MIDPWELVLTHERSAGDAERQSRGAFYTPRPVVEAIAALAITEDWLPEVVIDPTCGAGAFLLGALDRLVELGIAPIDALARVRGIDLDAGAIAASRAALQAWAEANGCGREVELDGANLVVGDGLGCAAAADLVGNNDSGRLLVLGNPPFATPLKGSPLPDGAHDYRRSHGDVLGPYADLAAVHLAAAVEACADGDRVVMVLPQSLVSSRDVAGLRESLLSTSPASAAWATSELVFDANVRVWAPVLEVGGQPVDDRSWSALLADSLGGPIVDLDGQPLGTLITATAGFRDEYYGLAAACIEFPERPAIAEGPELYRLVTVGALDPLWSWWGHRPITFAKKSWDRPVIDPSMLERKVSRWFERQRSPKVLLPTQSKVFEPVVDLDGSMVPVTPLISIQLERGNRESDSLEGAVLEGAVLEGGSDRGAPPLDDGEALTLEMVAAMLLAPPLVAWARRRWFGAALSVSAIKIPASAVAELPMPSDLALWRRAAGLIESSRVHSREAVDDGADIGEENNAADVAALVDEVAQLMMSAYGLDPNALESEELLSWWRDRLPAPPVLPTSE